MTMEFYVNNEKLDVTLENEKTVGDVLKSFETECEKNGATTVHIVLNGKNIQADEVDSILNVPVEDKTKLELIIISKADIRNSFEKETEVCDALSERLLELPVQLQSGKDKEAGGLISELADFVEQFCRTATLSALFPDLFGSICIDGKNVTEFFQDFSGILHDFEQAFSAQDTVLMGDLAEYEISPRLRSISASIKGMKWEKEQ